MFRFHPAFCYWVRDAAVNSLSGAIEASSVLGRNPAKQPGFSRLLNHTHNEYALQVYSLEVLQHFGQSSEILDSAFPGI